MFRRSVRLGVVLAVVSGSLLRGDIADEWVDLPSLRTPRQEVGVTGCAGRIYVIGGLLFGVIRGLA